MYLALTMLFISGCTLLGMEEQSGNGVLRVMLTDAPLDWETVDQMRVTISGVEISQSKDSWLTLIDSPQEVNLLELQNNVFITLGVKEIHAGTYEQLRLILDVSEPENNAIVYTDQDPQPFEVPSGGQTGIKIIEPIVVEVGKTTSVLLDFDAQSSVNELGNGDLLLSPTIKILDTVISDNTYFFVEDFGTGKSDNVIPNWIEIEDFNNEDKCMVVEGSELGGRMARIYGYDAMGTNHAFFKRIDLPGHEVKMLKLQARRSPGWNGDVVYLEFFYENDWHYGYTFTINNTGESFSILEIPLTEEMMDTMFYIRFRNGIDNQHEYLDIDNIEIYM